MSLAAIIQNVYDRGLLPPFLGWTCPSEGPCFHLPAPPTRLVDILKKIASELIRGEDLTIAAQLLIEIEVAGSAITYGGWNFNGIDVPLLEGGKAVNLILSNSIGGQSILAFVQVYNTMRPVGFIGGPSVGDMRGEILSWIQKSLKYLNDHYQNGQYTLSNGPFNVKADMSMLVLVFRGSTQDTQNMNQLAHLLEANLGTNTNVPILIVWEDTYGQVWFRCVAACDKVGQSDMSQIACNMMGYRGDCNARDATSFSSTDSIMITPPPPNQISCGDPNLVMKTNLICAQDLTTSSPNP